MPAASPGAGAAGVAVAGAGVAVAGAGVDVGVGVAVSGAGVVVDSVASVALSSAPSVPSFCVCDVRVARRVKGVGAGGIYTC